MGIDLLLKGANVIAACETGFGKSAIIFAPEVACAIAGFFCVSVAIVPTRALQENLASRLKKPCENLVIRLLNSDAEVIEFSRNVLHKANKTGQSSYFVLCDFESFGALKKALLQSQCRLGRFVFDEIHQMIDWKEDLRDCSAFENFLLDFPGVSCLMCSA